MGPIGHSQQGVRDMSDRVRVDDADAFEPGDRRFVDLDGQSVGVFNIDGEYYTLRNRCAHQNGPVCSGKLTRDIEGEFGGPGERVSERVGTDPAIACPDHGWEYDLATGRHLGDADVSLPTYPVVIEDGVVYIEDR